MPPQDSEDFRWFVDHLRPHEKMLRAWLQAQFPSAVDIDDLVQEAYLRVLHAGSQSDRSIESPKAFLFATARNLLRLPIKRHPPVRLKKRPTSPKSIPRLPPRIP